MNYSEAKSRILTAVVPEQLFGSDAKVAHKTYLGLAKIVHPDVADETDAETVFQRLGQLWEAFGLPQILGQISSGNEVYTLNTVLAEGDVASIYLAQTQNKEQVVCKVALDPQDNDLVEHEAEILRRLAQTEHKKFLMFVPRLLNSFDFREQTTWTVRRVNVLSYMSGFYTAKQIHDVYPNGIDPKDMAWIWRRLLMAMAVGHQMDVIHGAILPEHVLVHPDGHGLILIDWCYGIRVGEKVSAISSPYQAWYPKEVLAKAEAGCGVDIAMAARVMVYLLGGDVSTGALPNTIDKKFHAYFRACLLDNVRIRPQDAVVLIRDFNRLIDSLWKRAFHTFLMPH